MYIIRLLTVSGLLFIWIHAWGQTDKPLPADVRVVIDISGSMKKNDPGNLRRPALELLVQLLPEGSKAGVWAFGRYINMMVPHRLVDSEWRERASAKAERINSRGLFTNIGEALEKAGYDLDHPSDQYRTSLILLTDGMVDISPTPAENQAEWRRIVEEVLPRFQQAGYTVHTIALSDNADIDLLNKLALGTDGITAVAKSADDLMKIFLKAFDRAVPAEQVPLEENRFVVDSSIEEFTALIFRQPGSTNTRLTGPDAREYSFDKEKRDVSWYRADGYDLITIQHPTEGEWQVRAELDPDSRITVVSDLNLLVRSLKNNLFRGETLDLSLLLQEKGKTITRTEFLQLLDIAATLTHQEQGRIWQHALSAGTPPADGIYSTRLTTFDKEGHYDLKVVVDGKSFKREFSHTLAVREPYSVELEKSTRAGAISYIVTVKAYSQTIAPEKTQVVAQLKNPDGRSAIKPLQITEVDNWQLRITPSQEGVYSVAVHISGTDKQGQPFEFNPEELRFHYPDTDDPFAVAKPPPAPALEPELKPEPKPAPAPPPAEPPSTRPDTVAEPSRWPLYVGLAVGNLLIMVLAYFAYRMIMGGGGGASLKDLERQVNESEAEAENTEPTTADLAAAAERAKPKQPDPEPAMDEIAAPSEPSDELPDEADSDLVESLMADDLDLASDMSTEADIDELQDEASVLDVLEESDDGDDLDTDDFSLDDFVPDEDDLNEGEGKT